MFSQAQVISLLAALSAPRHMEQAHAAASTLVADLFRLTAFDYVDQENGARFDCAALALRCAIALIDTGRAPHVELFYREARSMRGTPYQEEFSPLRYEGRVSWGAHQVCVCDRLAFDPIIGRPVNINEYSELAFGQLLKSKVLLDTQAILAIKKDQTCIGDRGL